MSGEREVVLALETKYGFLFVSMLGQYFPCFTGKPRPPGFLVVERVFTRAPKSKVVCLSQKVFLEFFLVHTSRVLPLGARSMP